MITQRTKDQLAAPSVKSRNHLNADLDRKIQVIYETHGGRLANYFKLSPKSKEKRYMSLATASNRAVDLD